MTVVKFGKNKGKPIKAKKPKEKAEEKRHELIIPDAFRERAMLELSSYRELQTHKDVVGLIQSTVNGYLSGVLDSKQASTLGYLGSVSMQAINLAKKETPDAYGLDERALDGDLDVVATEDDLKALAAAPTREIQIRMINKIVTRTEQMTAVIPKGMEREASGPLKGAMKQLADHQNQDIQDVETIE